MGVNEIKDEACFRAFRGSRESSLNMDFFQQLYQAIESEKNTIILRRDPNKNRVIISQTRYLELLKKEEKLNELLKEKTNES